MDKDLQAQWCSDMVRLDLLITRKDNNLGKELLLSPLHVASFFYRAAVRTRTVLYEHGLLSVKRLPCPVISVGNITAGGTGKTPLVMALARMLSAQGIPVAILSRGYRGKKPPIPVVSDGNSILLNPIQSGDEPYLLASRLQHIPVLVGRNRFNNGMIAVERFGTKGFILDDGYQHIQLYRDLDILLIDSQRGFGNRHLLPRGILREPLSSLRRAHVILITKMDDDTKPSPIESEIRRFNPSAPVFHSSYKAVALVDPQGNEEDACQFVGRSVVAVSAIAHPESFARLLKNSGMKVIKEMCFPDHHCYSQNDLTRIVRSSEGADYIITTEKDMVKLSLLKIGTLPIRALRAETRIREEVDFLERVMAPFERFRTTSEIGSPSRE